jgi:hypothetical protein
MTTSSWHHSLIAEDIGPKSLRIGIPDSGHVVVAHLRRSEDMLYSKQAGSSSVRQSSVKPTFVGPVGVGEFDELQTNRIEI